MDFEELLPEQKSFDALAAYLNGSTVNVDRRTGIPQRYTGAYVTEDFLHDPRRVADDGARLHGRRQHVRRRARSRSSATASGSATSAAPPTSSARACASTASPATIVGVMPKGFAFPTNEELWIPLYSEFPPKPRNDPAAINPAVLGLLKPGVSLDQANAEFDDDRAAARRGVSRHQQAVQHRPGAAADRRLHAAPASRHAAGRCSGSASACCSSRAST